MAVQYQVSNQRNQTELPCSEPLSLYLPSLSFSSTKVGAGVGDGLFGDHISCGTAFVISHIRANEANRVVVLAWGAISLTLDFVEVDSPSLGFPSTEVSTAVRDGLLGDHISCGAALIVSHVDASEANWVAVIAWRAISLALDFVQIDSPSFR